LEFWLYKQKCLLLGSSSFFKNPKVFGQTFDRRAIRQKCLLYFWICLLGKNWKQNFPKFWSNKFAQKQTFYQQLFDFCPKTKNFWSIQFLLFSTFQNICSEFLLSGDPYQKFCSDFCFSKIQNFCPHFGKKHKSQNFCPRTQVFAFLGLTTSKFDGLLEQVQLPQE